MLKNYNIGRVIVCGSELDCPFRNDIEYLSLNIEDDDEENISIYFEDTITFIEQSLSNVLVHCYAGVSRSATIVIAYLIKCHRWSLEDSKSYLKSKRPCICPNYGFIRQLQEFEYKSITRDNETVNPNPSAQNNQSNDDETTSNAN